MPLPSPILDDRSYQQLRDELVRRIPVYTPEWTDHNASDPGITLISPARPNQKARVVTVTGPRVVLELQGGMGRSLTPEPGSVPAVGESVCYTTLSDAWQPPPALPEPEDTPWTHGGPPPVYVPSGEEAAEDWS